METNRVSLKDVYPPRIILVTNPAFGAGVARVQKELINDWNERGIPVTVIQIIDDRAKADVVNDYACDKTVIVKCLEKNRFLRFFNKFVKVRKIIKQEKAPVVAMTRPAANLMGIMSPFIKNQVIVSERNDPASYPVTKAGRIFRNLAFSFPDVCVFQTQQAKAYFSRRIQNKGTVIPNPINPNMPDGFHGERTKRIVAVGRLHDQKNYPMMLNAFKMFTTKHDEYTLEIYGDGPLKEKLASMVSELGLERAVIFKGYTTDIYNAISDAGMYVSSSDYEGISNSMLEAMALGLPTICTDCPAGGARDMIDNNENGILVPVGDSDAMCEAMCRVAEDPGFASKIGANAYKIREQYPVSAISQRWLDLMKQ